LDRTDFPFLQVARERPVFRNWNMYLKAREILEADFGRFGVLGLRPSFDKVFFIYAFFPLQCEFKFYENLF
jgi:hypothetical protein